MFAPQLQVELKPLLEFITQPKEINFDDDIVLVLKSFLKKQQYVSEILWTIFPELPKVLEKNKASFGNLLDTINYYLIFGRDEFINSQQHLQMVLQMANSAVQSQDPETTVHNAEGCIVFQLLLQIYRGVETLDAYLPDIITACAGRMRQLPMTNHLKRHIFCTILSALAHNPVKTFKILDEQCKTAELFKEIFQGTKNYSNIYEQKLFVVSLSRMMQAESLPPYMAELMP